MQTNKLRLAIRATLALSVTGLLAPSVHAQSATELQTQINDLQRQLDDMAESKGKKVGWCLAPTPL